MVAVTILVQRMDRNVKFIAYFRISLLKKFLSSLQILAVASQGVATLTDAGSTSVESRKDVQDVGQGMVEGGKVFAKGLLKGAVGVVANPLEGAEKGGLKGFMGGMAKARNELTSLNGFQ